MRHRAMMHCGIFLLALTSSYLPAISAAIIPSPESGDVETADVDTTPVFSTATLPSPRSEDVETAGADMTPLICRWFNYNELYDPGYVPVLRHGGKPNEMMWDHTHCGGVGLQLFCCPKETPQPVCTWREHKNSGHCAGGCKKGEAEFGSLKLGCKFEHQSACCSITVGTEPYSHCSKWPGKAPLECSWGIGPG
ncbi:hypothetical protein K458DRAFT_192416 [Lentithecium fluviatile CBS 122367]|uniref:Secreted protein n=1 Tax=Lentithecium fluviatile CBS 122367 TaxID=1168545 RepID=A0A6G1ID60_9PLEO|nr:hypothetical protein K458DRAFT_192416 [Lentithecium fluviatile CBS 122367]